MEVTENTQKPYRILSLDGGGAKGFYTLGVLDEIEKNTGKPICESFDLIFGTSTGSIIAVLLARGESVGEILKLYNNHVPKVMKGNKAKTRSKALNDLANDIFKDTTISSFKTGIGIVATNWKDERPLIFKASVEQAHGSIGSFVPFFGCSVADAVISSCSAYPFFNTHYITKNNGDILEVGDGGFCANNPTLYAIADAIKALNIKQENIRVVSLGVGNYPSVGIWNKFKKALGGWKVIRHSFNTDFLQKILETNTNSMDVLRFILFKNIETVRISDSFTEPTMATDLLEKNLVKLNRLIQKGRLSYANKEAELKKILNY